jgi:hypothetical protein
MKAVRQLAAISLAVLVVISSPGGAKGHSSGGLNVTTVVHDTDSGGAQRLLRSDDYNGIGEATYSAALNTGVSSFIYGVWFLNLYDQSVRTLWITPNDAINGSQPPGPPAGYYWQNVEVYSKCFDQNLNLVSFLNILTSSNNCSLGLDFYTGGVKYKLVMSPSLPAPGPATGLATVTCNAVSNNECVNWTITPNLNSGGANPPTVANLYSYGKRNMLTFVGQYYNTYRIDVTNP